MEVWLLGHFPLLTFEGNKNFRVYLKNQKVDISTQKLELCELWNLTKAEFSSPEILKSVELGDK